MKYKIAALRVMKQLLQDKITESPVNRGESYWIFQLIWDAKEKSFEIVKNRFQEEGKKEDASFWLEVFEKTAERAELSSLFFEEEATNILSKCLSAIIYPHQQFPVNEEKEIKIDCLQQLINQIRQFRSGKCMHYAALAMHYLLAANIRPLGSVWLQDKKNSSKGHNVIVIGLSDPQDYCHLAETDAIVFDYWAGAVFSARDAFQVGGPLADYDQSKTTLLLDISEHEKNPFILPLLNKKEINESKVLEFYAKTMTNIFVRRKELGEKVIDIKTKNEADLDQEHLRNLRDLKDTNRKKNIETGLDTLKKYEAVIKIQTAWRLFSKRNAIFDENGTSKMFPHKIQV